MVPQSPFFVPRSMLAPRSRTMQQTKVHGSAESMVLLRCSGIRCGAANFVPRQSLSLLLCSADFVPRHSMSLQRTSSHGIPCLCCSAARTSLLHDGIECRRSRLRTTAFDAVGLRNTATLRNCRGTA
jgi:hypothetical protein